MIEVDDMPRLADGDDRIRGNAQDARELRLRRAQRRLDARLLEKSSIERHLSDSDEGKRPGDDDQRGQPPPGSLVSVGQINERQAKRDEQKSNGNPECYSKLSGVNDGHAMPVDCRADSRPLDLR